MSDLGMGSASMAVFVNLTRGMIRTYAPVLPFPQIGSTANETTGTMVIAGLPRRKENQYVMNRQE